MTIYRANRRGAFRWFLAVALLAPLAVIPFLEEGGWARAFTLGVLWAPGALLGWIYVSTVYRIEGGELVYRSAFVRGRLPIDGIQEISSGTTLLVGLKPALAANGLIIKYNRYNQIYIAPEDNRELIAHLLELNPGIRVVDGEQRQGQASGGAAPTPPVQGDAADTLPHTIRRSAELLE